MDTQSNYTLPSSGQNWYNGGGAGKLPSSMIDFSSQVKPTTQTAGGLSSSANIKVASGATFDASLVTGGQEVSALTVDCSAGGGTLKGVRFASSGTLYLVNVSAGLNLSDYAVPLAFVGASDTGNVSSWTVRVNGSARTKRVSWRNGGLFLPKLGTVVFVR